MYCILSLSLTISVYTRLVRLVPYHGISLSMGTAHVNMLTLCFYANLEIYFSIDWQTSSVGLLRPLHLVLPTSEVQGNACNLNLAQSIGLPLITPSWRKSTARCFSVTSKAGEKTTPEFMSQSDFITALNDG